MEINIGKMTYAVEILTETGMRYDLSSAMTAMQWEDCAGELSQRGTFMFANSSLGDTWLHAVAKIGCIILVYSDWGEGKTLVYQGKIWEWTYSSGVNKEITISTYDYAKFLMQSSDSYYFTSGMDTKDMIERIAGDWGVSVNYQWGQTMTHEKKVFDRLKIGEIIISLVEEVAAHCEETPVCIWKDETFTIVPQGYNDFVFELDMYRVISTRDKISVNDMVTQVKVMGTADDEGRTLVEAVIEGEQDFGLLQTTLVRDSDKSLEDAIAEAETYLSEHGSPEEEIGVVAVDLPFLRKGEKVNICAGNLIGNFYVLSVCHNATQKQMSLTLERC
ncbi:MAG: hypothetical protein R3Y63_09035 [Eubacteriales bacterium]